MRSLPTSVAIAMLIVLSAQPASGQSSPIAPDGRPDADELFERWVAGDFEGAFYIVRWATEDCGDWHKHLVGRLLTLPWTHHHFSKLNGDGIWRAYSDCGDERVAAWVRTGLSTDLAAELFAPLVRTALRIRLDDEVLAAATDIGRPEGVRREALAQYARVRVDFEEMPQFIYEMFDRGALVPSYTRKWLPLLLAHPATRNAMATLGAQAIENDVDKAARTGLFEVVAVEVQAYRDRFTDETTTMVERAIAPWLDDLRFELQGVIPDVVRARDSRRNVAGRVVRSLDWEPRFEDAGQACVVIGLSHERAANDSVAPDFHLRMPSPCPHDLDYETGDFDADGSTDLAFVATVNGESRVLLQMNGEFRRLVDLGPVGRGGLEPVLPGPFYPQCYSGMPAQIWVPIAGFAVTVDEGRRLFYVDGVDVVEQYHSLATQCE